VEDRSRERAEALVTITFAVTGLAVVRELRALEALHLDLFLGVGLKEDKVAR